MAAVMQEPLLCRMNVRRNVALGLRFRRVPKPEVDGRVNAWLERLSISHLANRPASKLSGGESRRASLARAMVLDPEILYLDEPFAALDAPTRQTQLQEFRTVLAESGVSTVFATHDRGEALGLGDRVAVLMDGGLAQVGSAESVFARPLRIDVARFVGIDTLIPGRVECTQDGLARVDCGAFIVRAEGDFEADDQVCVAVRPEEIDLLCGSSPDVREPVNVLSGSVRNVVPAETHYRVEVDCGVSLVAAISRAKYREMRLEVGKPIYATFSPRSAHIIKNDNS
jgi:tungstate transport system ATP-binding protein